MASPAPRHYRAQHDDDRRSGGRCGNATRVVARLRATERVRHLVNTSVLCVDDSDGAKGTSVTRRHTRSVVGARRRDGPPGANRWARSVGREPTGASDGRPSIARRGRSKDGEGMREPSTMARIAADLPKAEREGAKGLPRRRQARLNALLAHTRMHAPFLREVISGATAVFARRDRLGRIASKDA